MHKFNGEWLADYPNEDGTRLYCSESCMDTNERELASASRKRQAMQSFDYDRRSVDRTQW